MIVSVYKRLTTQEFGGTMIASFNQSARASVTSTADGLTHLAVVAVDGLRHSITSAHHCARRGYVQRPTCLHSGLAAICFGGVHVHRSPSQATARARRAQTAAAGAHGRANPAPAAAQANCCPPQGGTAMSTAVALPGQEVIGIVLLGELVELGIVQAVPIIKVPWSDTW